MTTQPEAPSGTPRTDAVAQPLPHPNDLISYVPASLSRQLERELAAAQAEIAALREDAAYWNDIVLVDPVELMESVLSCHDMHSLRSNLISAIDSARKKETT